MLLLLSSTFLVPALGQGLLISAVAKNQFIASQLAALTGFLPAFMLSGFLFEIDTMPALIRALTYLIPARYFVSSLQTVFLTGDVWIVLLPNMLAMLAIGFVLFAIARAIRTRAWTPRHAPAIDAPDGADHQGAAQRLRDPRSRFVLIGPPLLQLFMLSFAATLEVRNVDIAVFNDDAGKASHELVARIAAASFVHRLRRSTARRSGKDDRAARRHRRNRYSGIFSRDIAAGRPATVQVILDGRRANSGQIVLGYLNAITVALGAELREPPGLAGDTVAVRHWFNPNLIYRWFVVPSIGGILVIFMTLLVTALSIARERELGTFDQLLVSPCTPIEIIASKMAPALVIGTFLGSFMVAAGVFLFRIPFTGSFPLLLLCMMLFILSVVGIGLMISSVCATQQQAILGIFTIAVPAVLMSGFATPVENMPVFLQWLAQAIPLKHYLIILQGSFLKSLPPSEVFANAWPMALIALVTLSTATLFVRSKLQ